MLPFGLAIVPRISLYHIETSDYTAFLSRQIIPLSYVAGAVLLLLIIVLIDLLRTLYARPEAALPHTDEQASPPIISVASVDG